MYPFSIISKAFSRPELILLLGWPNTKLSTALFNSSLVERPVKGTKTLKEMCKIEVFNLCYIYKLASLKPQKTYARRYATNIKLKNNCLNFCEIKIT